MEVHGLQYRIPLRKSLGVPQDIEVIEPHLHSGWVRRSSEVVGDTRGVPPVTMRDPRILLREMTLRPIVSF